MATRNEYGSPLPDADAPYARPFSVCRHGPESGGYLGRTRQARTLRQPDGGNRVRFVALRAVKDMAIPLQRARPATFLDIPCPTIDGRGLFIREVVPA